MTRDGVITITRRAAVADVADRFERAYSHYKTAPWKGDEPIASIVAKLRALDISTCDYSEVIAAIGSDWTELECDICNNKHCDEVARIGEEPDYEARWQDICLPCLADLGSWAAQAMAARSGETSGSTEGNSAVPQECATPTKPEQDHANG